MGRLTDNDKQFGPVTYGRTTWNVLRAVFSTGGNDDDERLPRNSLTVYGFGFVARVYLPTKFKPYEERHKAESWDATTIARLGRDWYAEVFPREYGFAYGDGFLQIFKGAQTHSSRTTQSWCKHLPWTQWRHVRFSLYDRSGALYWERLNRDDIRGANNFKPQYDAQKSCPAMSFVIRDQDGAEIIATTIIQERQWKFGEGWFKWLSLFRGDMVRRSLDINFSAETGPEKGSWKGGTTGTSIDMLPGEMHEAAFKRYCAQEHRSKYSNYRVEFIGSAP